MFIYAVIQCLQYGNSVAGREMIHPKNSLFRSLAYRVSVTVYLLHCRGFIL
jgi:hypothetical protein